MGTTDDFCYACGNLGFPDKKCPLCGREPTRKSMNFEFQDNTDFVKKIDCFGVPDMYRGIIWKRSFMQLTGAFGICLRVSLSFGCIIWKRPEKEKTGDLI